MQLNYDGGCPPYASNCLTWPLKCSSHALTYAALPQQRWRNDVLRTVVGETGCGSVLPSSSWSETTGGRIPRGARRSNETRATAPSRRARPSAAGGRRAPPAAWIACTSRRSTTATARLLPSCALRRGRRRALSPRGSATSWTPATSRGNSRRRRPGSTSNLARRGSKT